MVRANHSQEKPVGRKESLGQNSECKSEMSVNLVFFFFLLLLLLLFSLLFFHFLLFFGFSSRVF